VSLLLVYSETSSSVSDEEFHEWYDDEHIAIRTPLQGFLDAIRLVTTDGQKPRWAAIYALESLDVLKSPEYTHLLENRSDREKSVIARLDVLDRRMYNLIYTKSSDSQEKGEAKPQSYLIVGMTPSMGENSGPAIDMQNWYEQEHIPMFTKVPGWLRTRRFKLVENAGPGSPEAAPQFLAVHEFSDERWDASPEMEAARNTPWANKIRVSVEARERRAFKVWKVFK